MRYLMGIDNGGTFSKAAIFREDGVQIASKSASVSLFTPDSGFRERDLSELWEANAAVVKSAIEASGISPSEIAAVSVSGHGKGVYLVDKMGNPLGRGILSTDCRATDLVSHWERNGVAEKARKYTYQPVSACQPVALLAWLKEYDPDLYQQIGYVFSVNDYIRFCLTDQPYSEYTVASGSGFVDFEKKGYTEELLALFGIPEMSGCLPPLLYSSELAGRVTAKGAAATGLLEGTPVAAGMFDIDSCGIASGLSDPDNLCLIAGTWSINEYISDTPVRGEATTRNSFFCEPGRYLIEESSPTSAGNLEWFIRSQMLEEKAKARNEGTSIYDLTNEWVAGTDPQVNNVVYLPVLNGSSTEGGASGVFFGLSESTTKKDLVAAVYEGVVFSHRRHVEKLLMHRSLPKKIRLSGGVTNSAVWTQLFADALQLPVESVKGKESGALGAAMAAGVAAGIYSDLTDAVQKVVSVSASVEPRENMKEIYNRKYQLYCQLEDSLSSIWHR